MSSSQLPPAKKAKSLQHGDAASGGNAQSTIAGVSSAITLCNRLLEAQEEPKIDELTVEDAEGDNLAQWFITLVNALGNESCLKSNGEEYASKTLTGYLDKVREHLQSKFPGNEVLCNNRFFDDLKESLPKITARRQHKGTNETDVISKTIPIFRQSMQQNALFLDPTRPAEPVAVDLLQINEKLWRSHAVDTHETRLAFNMLYSSDTRPGEPKFVTYDKMYYEKHFNTTYANWFQMKQLTTFPTCWTNDYEYPETCVLHAFAAFWCAEDGLVRLGDPFRVPKSGAARRAAYVFPSAHAMNDNSFAQKLTNKVKFLVNLLQPSLKELASAKSFRIAASTAMAADNLLSQDESVFRGGWSTHTSRDHYTWILLVALIAPMMSLAGHPDPRALPYPPRLDALPNECHALLQQWIEKLYIIDVPYFKPGGKLRGFLDECTACLIMHFPTAIRRYGRMDKLNGKMVWAGLKAGLANNANGVIIKLREWAKHIRDDYDRRKLNPSNQRDEIVRRLVDLQRSTASDNENLRRMVQGVLAMLETRDNELVDLRSELGETRTQLREVKSLLQQLLGRELRPRVSASPDGAAAQACSFHCQCHRHRHLESSSCGSSCAGSGSGSRTCSLPTAYSPAGSFDDAWWCTGQCK